MSSPGPAVCVLCLCLLAACAVAESWLDPTECEVRARTEAGCVCGRVRWAGDRAHYVSFRGVPFAEQPTGERRFKELERLQPWGENLLDATEDGPICPQTDVLYGSLVSSRGMREDCIHANIHVPTAALPPQPAFCADVGWRQKPRIQTPLLPILVFIHGGGFVCGSGDSDLHGPEYLVSKNLIVITFNYRLNVFGFLSLNSKEIPGNQGLRDQITLLRWVQRNARNFGGDPNNVTLMGQSAGAVSAHLLTLSEATKGLFKRAFLMSGTGISGFYSPSPLMATTMSQQLLQILGINATEAPAEIHRQLVEMPIDKIHSANAAMLEQYGIVTFAPTVESSFPGVMRVVEDYPEALVAEGRGNSIPLIIGFTSNEGEFFRPRLEQLDFTDRITKNPILNVPVQLLFTTPPERLPSISEKIMQRYYDGTVTLQGFIDFCTEAYYQYPALRLAQRRAESGGAPVWVYEFSYESAQSPTAMALRTPYRGAAHVEDLNYVFRTNSLLSLQRSLSPHNKDDFMKDWMTNFVYDYMHCGRPVCQEDDKSLWPAVTPQRLLFQDIARPGYSPRDLPDCFKNIITFYDSLS